MFPDETFPDETGRRDGSAGEILAPAKLNLYLEVLGPRADGFHALETLMVPVRIYDQLFWHNHVPSQSGSGFTGKGLSLRVRNLLPNSSRTDQLLGKEKDNLVLRAAQLLAETAGVSPNGQFNLIKRIPVQAGMGGGSSDAAATLMLANTCWKVGYSQEQLMPLAAQLGSDVPFFLSRYFLNYRAAICRGRGELVEPVRQLPRLHFVVAQPTIGLSTADVFGQLPTQTKTDDQRAAASHSQLSELINTLQSGALASAGQKMTNRLESAAAQLAPWLDHLRETFSQIGSWGHFLTGSGSAYVGVMRSATQARQVARRLATLQLATLQLATSKHGTGELASGSSGAHMKSGNVFATSSC